MDIRPGEQYTVRRKILQLFGASFWITDPQGKMVGFCKQKAFKLKEDLRIYTDESCSTELVTIKARSVIDFSATYDVTLPDGTALGSLRRKGLASTFLRDSWLIFDPKGKEVAQLSEQGNFVTILRRYIDWIALFSPQRFTLARTSGSAIASFRTHFNPFSYRLSISVLADDPELDDLMILVTGCLIAAIEGRQTGG